MSLKRELIYINGKDETERIVSYSYRAGKCVIVFRNSNKSYSYNIDNVRIVKTAVSEDKAYNVFKYLQDIAEKIGLRTEEGGNILKRSYERVSVISKNSILANYLNGTIPSADSIPKSMEVFPFCFNLSQKSAVNAAFSSPLSIIEGPPGTGKTQTILNIIANAVMDGKSVAVVSSNNSATRNVFEKLEKSGVGFIAAVLGSSKNREEFIEGQTNVPDLSMFTLSEEEKLEVKERIQQLFHQLTDYLSKKNDLAILKQQLDHIKTEYQHFQNTYKRQTSSVFSFKKNITADALLALWVSVENQAEKRGRFGFIRRLIFRLKYGLKDQSFYSYSFEEMITVCQHQYYPVKISELTEQVNALEKSLRRFSFDRKMKEYTDLSMRLFKAGLHTRYTRKEREVYTLRELRSRSTDFIRDYPVIMSTTYSLRQCLSDDISYDYVIVDEASQVDIATGALVLSCAKRVVIVGDMKQLPNVVDAATQQKADLVFDSFALPEAYRYSNNSLLSSIMTCFPGVPKTLLREHYRCHPKIIGFCNTKFYNNELIVLSEQTYTRSPLMVYRTAPGNHARERMNQRQIDMIGQEIIPNERLENVDLGIVTPYRKQTDALQRAFMGTRIKADTVDKFQGRENKVIILSTVDNEISDFTDNPNRLNVAVSRATDQLILVVNGNDSEKDSNIADLIRYIEYNNFSIIESDVNSIFDFLYKGYEDKRTEILSKRGKVSRFDSENLMYTVVKDVLSSPNFSKYDVLLHFPLRSLIRDSSKLDEQERKYATHPLTHLDFLIYNRLDKSAVLAVEVDGFAYHKFGTRQEERDRMKDRILEKYGVSLLRFATNGSDEKRKLKEKLESNSATE